MTPALLMSRSRRDSLLVKVEAADAIEEKEVRSRVRCSMGAEGSAERRSEIAEVALEAVRAAR
jgi:hypothetical protein